MKMVKVHLHKLLKDMIMYK